MNDGYTFYTTSACFVSKKHLNKNVSRVVKEVLEASNGPMLPGKEYIIINV